MKKRIMKFAAGILAASLAGAVAPAAAQQALRTSIQNKHFRPAQLKAPAHKALRLTVHNADPIAAEFESRTLRVEKVVPAKSTVVINIKPLVPGKYGFFDDFNQSNQGVLVAQ